MCNFTGHLSPGAICAGPLVTRQWYRHSESMYAREPAGPSALNWAEDLRRHMMQSTAAWHRMQATTGLSTRASALA
eukprot:12645373-Alexandrium_andersonii.AAC.1